MLVGNATHVPWSRASVGGTAPASLRSRPADSLAADLMRVKAALTPSDREFIVATTGLRITDDHLPMPILAFEIASDRQTGVLPAGQPITTQYLHGIVEKYAASGDPLVNADYVEVATRYLAARGGAAPVDFRG